jgi:hypothetical protein
MRFRQEFHEFPDRDPLLHRIESKTLVRFRVDLHGRAALLRERRTTVMVYLWTGGHIGYLTSDQGPIVNQLISLPSTTFSHTRSSTLHSTRLNQTGPGARR